MKAVRCALASLPAQCKRMCGLCCVVYPRCCVLCAKFFHDGGPLQAPLYQVLESYGCYRPDVGYVQGMSHIASMLLLNMEPLPAFIAVCNLLNQDMYFKFFRMNAQQMKLHLDVFQQVFKGQHEQAHTADGSTAHICSRRDNRALLPPRCVLCMADDVCSLRVLRALCLPVADRNNRPTAAACNANTARITTPQPCTVLTCTTTRGTSAVLQ